MHELRLGTLAEKIGGSLCNTDGEIIVSSLSCSSGTLQPGALYVAIPGAKFDGHQFLDAAFSKNAVAAVVTQADLLRGRPGIVVAHARKAWSKLCAVWAGEPAQKIDIIAVTGTNGKTTTNWLIYHALEKLGSPPLRIGTLGAYSRQAAIDEAETLTTPDALFLHSTLRQAVSRGVQSAVFEASSHALDQNRFDDLAPNIGIFTNLTRDHLDYHKTFESYFQAKLKLFDLVASSGKRNNAAIVVTDSEYGKQVAAYATNLKLEVVSISKEARATLEISSLDQDYSGMKLKFTYQDKEYQLNSPFIGEYNAENLLCAFAACCVLGHPAVAVTKVLEQIPQVPGRLQSVPAAGRGIYIDYAHTPDALENVLTTLRSITKNKLWVVFGCGGDRDKGKRPLMAQTAARCADNVVVTSDNPRSESAEAIIADIMSSEIEPRFIERDRRAAIQRSISLLQEGDILCIAGKGHEDYQIIGTTKQHFSDFEEAQRALEQNSMRAD